MTTVAVQPSGEAAGGGTRLQGAGGGFTKQFAPAHPNQPLSQGPRTLQLSIGQPLSDIEDLRTVRSIAARAELGQLEAWLQLEFSDSWLITTGRVLWTITHRFAYGTVAAVTPPVTLAVPTVRVEAADGTISTTLTVVAAAPAAGEVQIDTTTDSELLTTLAGDLDAFAGERLVVYYEPLLDCAVDNVAWSRPNLNVLLHEVPLLVVPDEKKWSADTP